MSNIPSTSKANKNGEEVLGSMPRGLVGIAVPPQAPCGHLQVRATIGLAHCECVEMAERMDHVFLHSCRCDLQL